MQEFVKKNEYMGKGGVKIWTVKVFLLPSDSNCFHQTPRLQVAGKLQVTVELTLISEEFQVSQKTIFQRTPCVPLFSPNPEDSPSINMWKESLKVHSIQRLNMKGLYHLAIIYLEYAKWTNPNSLKVSLKCDWAGNLPCSCLKCRSLQVTNVLYIFVSITCFEICCGLSSLWANKGIIASAAVRGLCYKVRKGQQDLTKYISTG